MSGVLDNEFPSDVVIADFLGECKMRAAWLASTGAKMLSLNLDWLKKVRANAQRKGFRAGVLVSRAKGSPQLYVTMAWEDWLELVKESQGV